jgi:hypothetical protein
LEDRDSRGKTGEIFLEVVCVRYPHVAPDAFGVTGRHRYAMFVRERQQR